MVVGSISTKFYESHQTHTDIKEMLKDKEILLELNRCCLHVIPMHHSLSSAGFLLAQGGCLFRDDLFFAIFSRIGTIDIMRSLRVESCLPLLNNVSLTMLKNPIRKFGVIKVIQIN